jgi:flavin-dependent dehydrogenase
MACYAPAMNDVIVVGAGVAGAATAIHLARRGYSVELLDQASFPRRKPCGEGLFSPGVEELRALGVLDEVAKLAVELASMRFRLGEHVLDAPLPVSEAPNLGVRREVLDAALAKSAVAAGATLTTGVQVRRAVSGPEGYVLETTAGEKRTSIIVGADGLNSRLRHDAGVHRPTRGGRYGMSAHVATRAEAAPRIEVIFERGHELYLTPVAPDLLNVAVLLSYPASKGLNGNLRVYFEARIREAGVEGELQYEPMMAGPFPARASKLLSDNLVLVGDAAGFCDPITGIGMTTALRSARLVADAVERRLEQKPWLSGNAPLRVSTRNPELLARLLLFLAAHPALGRRAVDNLRRRPEAFTRLMALNAGILELRDLRPHDLSALLLGR